MDNKSPDAFRTISEVADWLGVPAHVLRFWESRFGQVKPVKRAGGRRYYRPSDMELLGGIRKLLHEDGLTIRGVQKLLRENGVKYVAAMSPPIDQSADLKDVSASSEAPREVEAAPHDSRSDHDAPAERETVAERDASGDRDTLGDRAAPIFDTDAEDAVEIAQTPEATQDQPKDQSRETASSQTAHTPHEPDAGAPDDRDSASQIDTQIDAEFAATADRVDTADTGATDHEDVEPEDTLAASPPFDSPEAIDFYAHEAQPETVEHAAPSREPSVSETLAPEQQSDIEAPPADGRDASHGSSEPGMDSEVAAQADAPEAHPVAASKSASSMAAPEIDATNPEPPEHAPDQAPDQAEMVAQEDVHQAPAPTESPLAKDDQAEDDDATGAESSYAMSARSESDDSNAPAPPSEAAIAPEPAVATAPDIVMPVIGADPEDDDVIPTAPAVAAALRRQRFRAIVEPQDADLDPAPFKAQLDRLQALSGRLGAAPDRRRSF